MTLSVDALERALHYPLANRLPPAGGAIEIAPGLKWLRMPMPFALDHINLWLLRDRVEGRDGWAVVDCCIDCPEGRAAWEDIFERELEGLPIVRVFVTHMHPDHVGLAHWLCERWSAPGWDCRLWMSAADYQTARYFSQNVSPETGADIARYFASHGMTNPDDLEQLHQRRFYYHSLVPRVPRAYARLLDGLDVTIGGERWRCIVGHGHAPEHIALYGAARGILISGDMVLPRISPNVSVYDPEPEGDPLALFLASLERYRALPADTLVLPAHGKPFTGLHTRLDQLRDHHHERLADVMVAARQKPVSAWDILPLLFHRKLDLHQSTFAVGEAVAHLNNLWHTGQLTRARGADGIWRYAAAG
ncbi:MAG: MBL fold metallo-hydrolase [Burkholderiaceae bacterium]|jgi:glyoxylase-like metal-dependent hydrolase (beta-lactamase superfamily II)|nr:MBL fold metallo-hydrolase [Burkholderiaceae bacterium]